MRTLLPFICVFLFLGFPSIDGFSQITTPTIRANFGVDADLECNFMNTQTQSNDDDWFWQPGSSGTGLFIIDTSGAAAINRLYATNVASRRFSFIKRMRYPEFSILNNKLL